jgi:hypothetical protein
MAFVDILAVAIIWFFVHRPKDHAMKTKVAGPDLAVQKK